MRYDGIYDDLFQSKRKTENTACQAVSASTVPRERGVRDAVENGTYLARTNILSNVTYLQCYMFKIQSVCGGDGRVDYEPYATLTEVAILDLYGDCGWKKKKNVIYNGKKKITNAS